MSQIPNSPSRRRVRGRLAAVLAVVAVGGLLFALRQPLLRLAGEWLDVGQTPRRCDFALVLMGDEETRPFVAAALYRRGLARRVLLNRVPETGINQPTSAPSSHQVAQRILQLRDVPPDKVTILTKTCATTFDEASSLADFLRGNPSATVAVVTNGFHTRRARWIFRRALGEQKDQVYFVSAPCDGFNATNWWRNERGFVVYLMEFGKFGYYWWRYGEGLWWCAGLVVLPAAWWLWRRRSRSLVDSLAPEQAS